MEQTYEDLAERALRLLEQSPNYRVVILLIGAPGSGKSTVAERCVQILNKWHKTRGTCLMGGDPIDSSVDTNNDLPLYNKDTPIDVEDDHFIPTRQIVPDGVVIRGRGGDDTAIKVQHYLQDGTHTTDCFAQAVPMDGFHLPRSVLAQFKDPVYAAQRRGSPFTFDSSLVVELIHNLQKTIQVRKDGTITSLDTSTNMGLPNIYVPSFDHTHKDPKTFDNCIHSTSRIVIVEGLYLLLNNPVWCDIPRILDPNVSMDSRKASPNTCPIETQNAEVSEKPITPRGKSHEFWKILIDDSKILSRLGNRHLQAGIVPTLQEGEDRVKVNDLPNGKKIYSESFKSDIDIFTIDDPNENSV